MERINDRLVSWASLLDDQTRQQAITSAEIDFIYPHIALMPDAHLGYGATVGSVIPTLGAVMPAAVGVDIGCGMTAVQTQFKYTDLPSNLTKLREEIERSIPVSAGRYNRKILPSAAPRVDELEELALAKILTQTHSIKTGVQLGTLGGGNHFIEICLDETDKVWTFCTRITRIGNKIAQYHIDTAKICGTKLAINYRIRICLVNRGDRPDLIGTRTLRWAQHFALLNRKK